MLDTMEQVDVAIVGTGAAGLSLACRLAELGTAAPSVALFEPADAAMRPRPRTWCFWEGDGGDWDGAVTVGWRELSVIEPDGVIHRSSTAPLSYKMIRSPDFERIAAARIGEADRILATVTGVEDGRDHAVVHAVDAGGRPRRLRARWVFDTRPPREFPGATTTLLQHFQGWFVRASEETFDARHAVLMDLRTPQPYHGVSFGYLLPLSPREALVEYTEFSPEALDTTSYEERLRHYIHDVLRLGAFTITTTEQGAIPITDAPLPARVGRRVYRIGIAGGATRPSTGYTFSGIQRQTRSIAAAFAAQGTPPARLRTHAWRHLFMDALLLRALDTGRIDGAAYFGRLFRRNPLPRLLRFLDGDSTIPQELAIGASTHVWPMTRTLVERLSPGRP